MSIALCGQDSLHFKQKLHSPFPVKNSNGSSKILICFGHIFSHIPHSTLPTHLTGLLDSFKKEYSLTTEATAAKGQKYLQYILGYHTDKTKIAIKNIEIMNTRKLEKIGAILCV